MASILKTSINLNAIPKDKIINGKKGKYLPITITVNDDLDQFGNQGPLCVDQTKEYRDAHPATTYLVTFKVVSTHVHHVDTAQRNAAGAPPPQPPAGAPARVRPPGSAEIPPAPLRGCVSESEGSPRE